MEKIQKYLRNGIFLLAGIFTVLSVFKPTTIGLGAGKVMLVIAIAAALIFPIIFLIQQPKQGLKDFVGLWHYGPYIRTWLCISFRRRSMGSG